MTDLSTMPIETLLEKRRGLIMDKRNALIDKDNAPYEWIKHSIQMDINQLESEIAALNAEQRRRMEADK